MDETGACFGFRPESLGMIQELWFVCNIPYNFAGFIIVNVNIHIFKNALNLM